MRLPARPDALRTVLEAAGLVREGGQPQCFIHDCFELGERPLDCCVYPVLRLRQTVHRVAPSSCSESHDGAINQSCTRVTLFQVIETPRGWCTLVVKEQGQIGEPQLRPRESQISSNKDGYASSSSSCQYGSCWSLASDTCHARGGGGRRRQEVWCCLHEPQRGCLRPYFKKSLLFLLMLQLLHQLLHVHSSSTLCSRRGRTGEGEGNDRGFGDACLGCACNGRQPLGSRLG